MRTSLHKMAFLHMIGMLQYLTAALGGSCMHAGVSASITLLWGQCTAPEIRCVALAVWGASLFGGAFSTAVNCSIQFWGCGLTLLGDRYLQQSSMPTLLGCKCWGASCPACTDQLGSAMVQVYRESSSSQCIHHPQLLWIIAVLCAVPFLSGVAACVLAGNKRTSLPNWAIPTRSKSLGWFVLFNVTNTQQ